MDPYLLFLLYIIAGLDVVILLFLLLIAAARVRHNLNESAYRRSSELWENHFLNYLQGEISLASAAAQFREEKSYARLRRFFTPYLVMLEGDDFEKTKTLCGYIGLIDYYQKKLARGGTFSRAIAASTLASLRCKKSFQQRLRLLQSNKPLLVTAAAQGFASAGETTAFIPVTRALLGNSYFTYEGATGILTGFGRQICGPITQALEEMAAGSQVKLFAGLQGVDNNIFGSLMIGLIAHYRYKEALPVLNKLLPKADEEATVHILKAFLRIGELPPSFTIEPYLQHKYWVVRSFSARLWKLSKKKSAIPLLEELTADQNWWVRFHAAEALLKAGPEGPAILKRLAEGPHRAAAGISRYLLEISEVN